MKKMSQKAKDIRRGLRNARKLIEKKENWTIRTFARDKMGFATSPEFPEAFRFCAVGAMKRSFSKAHVDDYRVGCMLLKDCIPGNVLTNKITTFNDLSNSVGHHQEVLAMFDCAIEKAKEIV